MIISVEELKQYIKTTETDAMLEAKLRALELSIREYTNNNFQQRNIRAVCQAMAQMIYTTYPYFKVGDTIQISQSIFNDGIYKIESIVDGMIILDKKLIDENGILVTKVEYPADVVMGAINMLKWDLENRDKVGIQSETISRHSVTYFNMDGDNSTMGYPKSLLGFLKPYMKARF
jgi:hypothetical protein